MMKRRPYLALTVLLIGVVVTSTAAQAERGWACIEENGLIQKYKIAGSTMIPEGDAFTRLMEDGAKQLGKVYEPYEVWHITVNNVHGLIAVNASANKPEGLDSGVYIDTLMIEKPTGRYRHIYGTITGKLTDITGGTCTDY